MSQAHVDPLELLTIPEVAALFKCGRRFVEREIASGHLHAVKLGHSTRVPRAELERYIEDAADADSVDGDTPDAE